MNRNKNKCDHKEYEYGEGFCCEEQYKEEYKKVPSSVFEDCKKCIDLNETSMICKSCIKELHMLKHPNDGKGKYFMDMPMCYCVTGIDIEVVKDVPKVNG
jgi:hypothetical protein